MRRRRLEMAFQRTLAFQGRCAAADGAPLRGDAAGVTVVSLLRLCAQVWVGPGVGGPGCLGIRDAWLISLEGGARWNFLCCRGGRSLVLPE